MDNELENVLDEISVGDEILIEDFDSNSALNSRIIDRIKVGNRVNSDLRYHRRNVPKSKWSYLRNDLPRTYLLADALLREVKESSDEGYDAIPYDSLQAEYWDP